MNKQLLALHQERGRLLERIAYQRAQLAVQLEPLQKASDTGNRIVAVAQAGVTYLRSHPVGVLAALSALVWLRPSGSWRLLRRGLMVWQSWRRVRAWLPESLRASLRKLILERYFSR